MLKIEFNQKSKLFEVVDKKNGVVRAKSTGHEAAIRIMDRLEDKMTKENTRDIDKENEDILIRHGFTAYDTEQVSDRRCEDCGRFGHCEC
jgi:hypothetical protein